MAAFEFQHLLYNYELGYQESCMTASNAFFVALRPMNQSRVKASQCPLVSIDAIAFRASRIVRRASSRRGTHRTVPLDTNMVAG